ncbi:hypothetical protein PCANC_13136 [Puccinia coronata f. sp. avenae]|uniref:Uncharacterized protein n=1 Tax=Puccinia coronata f. sp. avenae TaxID=200324 RepID=A0A2N5UWA5_9BASI|nr:hypothetical protein PCANC_13136 [Puccinia coronata f. sp. avenae]
MKITGTTIINIVLFSLSVVCALELASTSPEEIPHFGPEHWQRLGIWRIPPAGWKSGEYQRDTKGSGVNKEPVLVLGIEGPALEVSALEQGKLLIFNGSPHTLKYRLINQERYYDIRQNVEWLFSLEGEMEPNGQFTISANHIVAEVGVKPPKLTTSPSNQGAGASGKRPRHEAATSE